MWVYIYYFYKNKFYIALSIQILFPFNLKNKAAGTLNFTKDSQPLHYPVTFAGMCKRTNTSYVAKKSI